MVQPTYDRVRHLLAYKPRAGIFIWRVPSNRWGRTPAGAVAGTLRPDGRRHIYIDGKNYLASRIAVLWMTGEWPNALVDHKNGKKSDDRWSNLRLANKSQNAGNSKRPRTNTSGFKGVQVYKYTPGKWSARIKRNGKMLWLGLHRSPEDAHNAYLQAAKEYFGEFARGA